MLSANVLWTDIDAAQWANLWRRVYAPDRRPQRAIGILEGEEPIALVVGDAGAIPLDVWPKETKPLPLVADDLRRRLEVDQVILIERPVLTALWDEQQRSLDHEADYDDFLLGIRNLTERTLRERAICSPPELVPLDFPTVPYEELRALVEDAVGSDGAFVVTVFDADELWWSLAGSIRDGKIVRLTSSQGLLAPGATLDPAWLDAHDVLVAACAETLGPVRFALALQLSAFDALLRTDDPGRALSEAVEDGSAGLSTG